MHFTYHTIYQRYENSAYSSFLQDKLKQFFFNLFNAFFFIFMQDLKDKLSQVARSMPQSLSTGN